MKRWILFVLSLILAAFFIWFGFQLLTLARQPVTTNQLFFLGCACILGGVFAVSKASKGHFLAAGGLVLVGVYYFARSGGLIENSMLVRLLGAASFVAAGLMVYVYFPTRVEQTSPSTEETRS